MQNQKTKAENKKVKSKSKSKSKETGAFETFALSGGRKNPRSGTTIPSDDSVVTAKKFVEENKK